MGKKKSKKAVKPMFTPEEMKDLGFTYQEKVYEDEFAYEWWSYEVHFDIYIDFTIEYDLEDNVKASFIEINSVQKDLTKSQVEELIKILK